MNVTRTGKAAAGTEHQPPSDAEVARLSVGIRVAVTKLLSETAATTNRFSVSTSALRGCLQSVPGLTKAQAPRVISFLVAGQCDPAANPLREIVASRAAPALTAKRVTRRWACEYALNFSIAMRLVWLEPAIWKAALTKKPYYDESFC